MWSSTYDVAASRAEYSVRASPVTRGPVNEPSCRRCCTNQLKCSRGSNWRSTVASQNPSESCHSAKHSLPAALRQGGWRSTRPKAHPSPTELSGRTARTHEASAPSRAARPRLSTDAPMCMESSSNQSSIRPPRQATGAPWGRCPVISKFNRCRQFAIRMAAWRCDAPHSFVVDQPTIVPRSVKILVSRDPAFWGQRPPLLGRRNQL